MTQHYLWIVCNLHVEGGACERHPASIRLMTLTITRRHVIVAIVVVLVGASTYGAIRLSTSTAHAALPGVMQCSGKVQARPESYVLSCAGANSELLKIHWTLWSSQTAVANATFSFDDCTLYCATGTFHSYPATVRLSSPRSTKSGLLFSEANIAYNGPSGRKIFTQYLPTTLRSGIPSVPTSTSPAPVGSGYLNTSATSAAFIQWNTNGSNISGTIQLDYIEGNPPNEQLSANTESVSGQINGSQISMSFSGGSAQFGTISGGGFTLDVPQSDGSLAPATFESATAAQFNQAVSALNSSVSSSNTAANQAAATANAESTINGDGSTVTSDISGLGQDASTAVSDAEAISNDLGTEQADLASTASAEQSVANEAKSQGAGSPQVCSDSDGVASDADGVASDADGVVGDVTTVRNDIGGLQSDFAALQSAQATLPSYNANAPTQADVNSAIASAEKSVSAAINQTNNAIDRANAYQSDAYQEAIAANNAGGCQSPPSPPQTLQHIS